MEKTTLYCTYSNYGKENKEGIDIYECENTSWIYYIEKFD